MATVKGILYLGSSTLYCHKYWDTCLYTHMNFKDVPHKGSDHYFCCVKWTFFNLPFLKQSVSLLVSPLHPPPLQWACL